MIFKMWASPESDFNEREKDVYYFHSFTHIPFQASNLVTSEYKIIFQDI